MHIVQARQVYVIEPIVEHSSNLRKAVIGSIIVNRNTVQFFQDLLFQLNQLVKRYSELVADDI